ncbi:MAG: hypothetical protein ACLGHY_03380, partial [Gammaproteobacteria bacterium]
RGLALTADAGPDALRLRLLEGTALQRAGRLEQAREVLRSRRIEERYEDWLRQVRDSAYVEYKLDGN